MRADTLHRITEAIHALERSGKPVTTRSIRIIAKCGRQAAVAGFRLLRPALVAQQRPGSTKKGLPKTIPKPVAATSAKPPPGTLLALDQATHAVRSILNDLVAMGGHLRSINSRSAIAKDVIALAVRAGLPEISGRTDTGIADDPSTPGTTLSLLDDDAVVVVSRGATAIPSVRPTRGRTTRKTRVAPCAASMS